MVSVGLLEVLSENSDLSPNAGRKASVCGRCPTPVHMPSTAVLTATPAAAFRLRGFQ